MTRKSKFTIDRDKLELTEEEKEIEKMLNTNYIPSIPNFEEEKKKFEEIARNTLRKRSTKHRVSL